MEAIRIYCLLKRKVNLSGLENYFCVLFKKYLSENKWHTQRTAVANHVRNFVLPVYFDFFSLTFCYATVIPLLIIFLARTFIWPLNIIAVLGAGAKYHTLINIYKKKNCN